LVILGTQASRQHGITIIAGDPTKRPDYYRIQYITKIDNSIIGLNVLFESSDKTGVLL
jgi:hypothetical protein